MMKSMFLLFCMFLNNMGGYLFREAAVEKVYPDIARICPDITLSNDSKLTDGASWISFLKGLDSASASSIRIVIPGDDEQNIVLTYDAVKKSFTVTENDGTGKAVTYRYLIRMDGQSVADMKMDDMIICFAEDPAKLWYWYLSDDADLKPEDIYRKPNAGKAHLLFSVYKS